MTLSDTEMKIQIEKFGADNNKIDLLVKKLYMSTAGCHCSCGKCHIEYLTDGEKMEYANIFKELRNEYKAEGYTGYNITKKSKSKLEQQYKKCYTHVKNRVDTYFSKFNNFL